MRCALTLNYYVLNCSFKNACLSIWHRETGLVEPKLETCVKAKGFDEVLPRLNSLTSFLVKCALPGCFFPKLLQLW